MHVFPLYIDQLDCSQQSNSVSPVSKYMKTIAKSIYDQQLLLSAADLESNTFKWTSKVVHHAVNALQALATDNINLATLALTGLSRLVPTPSPKPLSNEQDAAAVKVFTFSDSFTAISETSDEAIMQDIKIDVNSNKWETFLSLVDLVSSSLGERLKSGYRSGGGGEDGSDKKVFPLALTTETPRSAKALGIYTESGISFASDSECSSPGAAARIHATDFMDRSPSSPTD
jgi:hypothetical protein